MDQMESQKAHYLDEVFRQVTHVLSDAFGTISSEVRLALDAEVAETLRFDQAQQSWTQRLANTRSTIEMNFAHPDLERVSGLVIASSDKYVELLDGDSSFLINLSHVITASGLAVKSVAESTSAVDSQLDSMWLHDASDSQRPVTVWCGLSRRVTGYLVTVGSDFIDLEVNGQINTVNTTHLVCATTML